MFLWAMCRPEVNVRSHVSFTLFFETLNLELTSLARLSSC